MKGPNYKQIVKTDRHGHTRFIQYNTGDRVWFRWEKKQYTVIKIKTHDSLLWLEGMKRIISVKEFWRSLIPVLVLVMVLIGLVLKENWSIWF